MLAQAAFSEVLAATLTRVLALDPDHARLLKPLAGRIVTIELIPFDQRITLSFTLDTVFVLSDFPGKVDLTLKGSPLAFARLASSPRFQSRLFQGEIQVIGDVHVARRLQILLQCLNLDWESWLADVAGERLAHLVAASIRVAAAWHRHTLKTFQWNLAEFLQEETRALPAPMEAEELYRRIGQLRDDVARLEARVRRLKASFDVT